LRVYWCGEPSLTRGWVLNLLVNLLIGFASAVTLRSKFRGTHNHILCFIWDSPNLEGKIPVFLSLQEQGGPVMPSGTSFHFRRLLRLTGLCWRYSNPPPHGVET
jgi:hypothetical protein